MFAGAHCKEITNGKQHIWKKGKYKEVTIEMVKVNEENDGII